MAVARSSSGGVANAMPLCISVFMDDIIFAHNELAIWGMSMPLQRVTSLRRRAQQANALATSYWLRRVLDNGGR